ncbi:hypothetical protein QOZ80_1AG0016340 [Eleusine coracana subsp. coracana]|nr:hypothetical protein QOZ80_1AG0016340 [Eleusine coracana subsp. coracana]
MAAIPRMNLTVAASGVFQFKVEGYFFTKETVTSEHEYYQSDMFLVGGHEWAVRYYPKKAGSDEFRAGLVLLSRPTQGISVRFTLTTLCKSGVPSDTMKGVATTDVNCAAASYYGFGAREVLSFLVGHASMPEFLENDSFVLHCTVSVLKRPVSL